MGLGGDLGTIWASMKLDVSGVSAGMDRVKRELATGTGMMRKHADELNSIGKSYSLAISAPIIAGLGVAFKSAAEQAEALHELQVSLEHTGEASATTMQKLKGFSDAMLAQTVYSDEAVISQMAYMHNLGVETGMLQQAEKAAMGLAAKYKIDLSTATMLVGRASQGATQMLGRYGIVIDDQLSKTEKFAKVLQIGSSSFDLVTKATETLSGQFAQMRNYLDEVAEDIGGLLLPYARAASVQMRDLAKGLSEISPGAKESIISIGLLVAGIGPLLIVLAKLPGLIAGVRISLTALGACSGPVLLAIAGVVAAGYGLYKLIGYLTRDTIKEAKATAESAKSRAEQAKQTQGLVGEYNKLAGKTNATVVESTRMHDVLQEIWKLNPSLISAYDAQRGALGLVANAYNEAAKYAERYGRLAKSAQQTAIRADIRQHKADIAGLKPQIREAVGVVEASRSGTISYKGWDLQLAGRHKALTMPSDKQVLTAANRAAALTDKLKQKQAEMTALEQELHGGAVEKVISPPRPTTTRAPKPVATKTKASKPTKATAPEPVDAFGMTAAERENAYQAAVESARSSQGVMDRIHEKNAAYVQAENDAEKQSHDQALALDLDRMKWQTQHSQLATEDYLSALQDRLDGEQQYSSNWYAIHSQLEAGIAEEASTITEEAKGMAETNKAAATEYLNDWLTVFSAMGSEGVAACDTINGALDSMKAKTKETTDFWGSTWGYALDSFREVIGNIRTSFADALASMIQGLSTFGDFMKQVWHQILVFVINVIIQMVAEWIKGQKRMQKEALYTQAITAGISAFGGGIFGGIFKGVGKILGVKGFDSPTNDAQAVRWGADFSRLFNQGITSDLGRVFPTQRPVQPVASAAANHTTTNTITVTTHVDKVSGIEDIERLSETQAWIIGQKLNTNPVRA